MAEEKKERLLFLNGEITDGSLNSITEKIIEYNQEDKKKEKELKDYQREPIKLLINSPGGSIYATLGLINTMELSKTPIYTYCIEKAMSGGFLIFCSGDKRIAHPDASLMWHDMSYMNHGPLKQHKEDSEWYTRLMKTLTRKVFKNTRITEEQLENVYEKKKDWYMTGEEANKLDVCTELLEELF